MKILMLQEDFPPLARGGAGVVAAAFAREYTRQGHDICVVTAAQDKAQAGWSAEDGVRIERFYSDYHPRWRAWRCLYNPAGVAAVRKALADFEPDAVHAHNIHKHISYYALMLAQKSGAQVILTAHDAEAFNYGKLHANGVGRRISAWTQLREQKLRYNPFRNFMIRLVLRHSVDRTVAVSFALRDVLARNGISAEVIYNGIEAGAWDEPQEEIDAFKARHGIGGRGILVAGRLSGAKGGMKIIEALVKLCILMPDAQLLVLADAYEEKMRDFAKRLKVSDRIVFLGWRSGAELRQAYHAAAVVAVPSLYLDPFPTVVLEAMACGKPVVATCLGGAREAVLDGKTGYIVDPNNTGMVSSKLAQLLGSSALMQMFGEVGRRRVAEQFSLRERAADYLRSLSRF